ncbi:MAG: VanZ family protein [Bacillota bacterium]
MDKNIESYIDQIVSELICDERRKEDLIDEMKDHLYLLKSEYLEQGLPDEEASQMALKRFGEQKFLKNSYQESLNPFYRIFKIAVWTLFSLYSFIILFKLLFQRILLRITDYANAVSYGFPSTNRYFFYPQDSNGFFDIEVWKLNANIIPFQNTINYITGSDRFNQDIIINNTIGNIVIFLPLGLFLPMLFKRCRSLLRVSVSSIIITFSIEILQFLLQIGQFDIDDIILNTTGCILGFLIVATLQDLTNLIKKRVFTKVLS